MGNESGSSSKETVPNENLSPQAAFLTWINSQQTVNRSQIATLMTKNKELSDVKLQLGKLKKNYNELAREKSLLNSDNVDLRQLNDSLLEEFIGVLLKSDEDMKSQLQTLRQRNGILESEKVSLCRNNAHLRQEKDKLHDKCVSYDRSDKDMKAQIATLLSRNKKLATDNLQLKGSIDKLSKECTELKTCNGKLHSQLSDHELLRVLLDLRDSLQEIEKNIDEVEADNSLSEETEKLKGQISKKKDENRKLEDELQRRSYEFTNHDRTRQLIRAEIELETTSKDVCNFLARRRQYLSSITENIQKYMEEFGSNSTSVDKIKSKLKNYSEKLVKLQDEGEDLKKQQQKECETILALLDKQNHAIKILLTLSDADRNQSDVKRYAIKILNLEESNASEDYRTVLDIINSIHAVPEEDIEVQRVEDSCNSTRPIMVYLPSIGHVRKILSASRKLKNSKYHYVQIAPGKKREEAGEETPPQQTSATFSYELA